MACVRAVVSATLFRVRVRMPVGLRPRWAAVGMSPQDAGGGPPPPPPPRRAYWFYGRPPRRPPAHRHERYFTDRVVSAAAVSADIIRPVSTFSLTAAAPEKRSRWCSYARRSCVWWRRWRATRSASDDEPVGRRRSLRSAPPIAPVASWAATVTFSRTRPVTYLLPLRRDIGPVMRSVKDRGVAITR